MENTRNLTAFDRLVAAADCALRVVSGNSASNGRASPAAEIEDAELSAAEKAHAAGLMRINHAGEIAAQGLYQGQAVTARLGKVRAQMERAAAEELDHLAWCQQRLSELDSQPSRLAPLWFAGSFCIGAAAGLAGDRWSLGFVAETERQVVAHLKGHYQRLPEGDNRSLAILRQMEDDEARHAREAGAAGGADLPAPVRTLMGWVARVMTTTAYRV